MQGYNYCGRCNKWRIMFPVGRRLSHPYTVAIWEVELECSFCGNRVWTPSNPPKEEKDETTL